VVEVVDIHAITYDIKRKYVMRRTTKKWRFMLDITLLITTKEMLLIIENAKTTELIDVGMAITNATMD
jgi:hypothetical protein